MTAAPTTAPLAADAPRGGHCYEHRVQMPSHRPRPMIVMPACSSGWFWHCLARETGRLGHLFSPGAQRGPWPWLPEAYDNGNFALWTPETNTFDFDRWNSSQIVLWRQLMFWAQVSGGARRWAIVPDVPGNAAETLRFWKLYSPEVIAAGIPLALAVQNGMTPADVYPLDPAPEVICVGGDTAWKWETAEMWCSKFPRVHVLRCNSPAKLDLLDDWGAESTDGTGWQRGDRKQTAGLENWCRARAIPTTEPLTPHVSRAPRCRHQMAFA